MVKRLTFYLVYLRGIGGWDIIAHVDAPLGRRSEAEQIVRKMKDQGSGSYESPVNIAAIYVQLGDSREADVWLAKALKDNDLNVVWLRADPRFLLLQPKPSFQQITATVFRNAPLEITSAR